MPSHDSRTSFTPTVHPSRTELDNFTTNRISLTEFEDNYATGERAVLGLAAAWACVRLLAGTIASLPLMVYRTDRQGRRTVARDHPLYRLLKESPNADQTALDFWEFIGACIELRGNAYAEKEVGGDGRLIALSEPIPPQLVRPERASGGAIRYEIEENGRKRFVPQDRLLHIPGFGGSALGGLSTLTFGRMTFGSALAIERAAAATFRNGVMSTGAFMSQRTLDDKQMADARKMVTEKYVGAVKAGVPLILNSDMKFESLSINPDDAQMIQSRAFGVEEICRIFGVPPFMVGHTEKSTSWGTGIEQQMRMFYVLALRTRLERIEQSLKKQLLTARDRTDGIEIEFNVEGLLRGDSKSRAEFYASGLQNGWRTINEVRALENLPPVDGGDTPRMQMQNVPITEATGIEGGKEA